MTGISLSETIRILLIMALWRNSDLGMIIMKKMEKSSQEGMFVSKQIERKNTS